jgi:hypothetical protein
MPAKLSGREPEKRLIERFLEWAALEPAVHVYETELEYIKGVLAGAGRFRVRS